MAAELADVWFVEGIATLATKAELRAEAEETRRHFDVVAEAVRYETQMLAGRSRPRP